MHVTVCSDRFASGVIAAKNRYSGSDPLGHQRDWVWRGWQVRYAFRPAESDDCGVPMLLLHGFGASIGHWQHNVSAFSQHHSVYALDLVGFGASEKSTTTYNTDIWTAQVYEF
ncbi:MAG: hypothetical protein NZ772_16505, partial [Cyanobacteria bacterium]|nr:hypothetical protein [Cyanobacteriota bacterium]MDW8202933.1 hypothetical protein [Cyanobacteriota bacterium SKYGB_h_bin112]